MKMGSKDQPFFNRAYERVNICKKKFLKEKAYIVDCPFLFQSDHRYSDPTHYFKKMDAIMLITCPKAISSVPKTVFKHFKPVFFFTDFRTLYEDL